MCEQLWQTLWRLACAYSYVFAELRCLCPHRPIPRGIQNTFTNANTGYDHFTLTAMISQVSLVPFGGSSPKRMAKRGGLALKNILILHLRLSKCKPFVPQGQFWSMSRMCLARRKVPIFRSLCADKLQLSEHLDCSTEAPR